MREPLKVQLADEERARTLARELTGIDGVEVGRHDGGWQVSVLGGDRVVVQVLDAVRRALAGQPTASARVVLDGREYRLQGE